MLKIDKNPTYLRNATYCLCVLVER